MKTDQNLRTFSSSRFFSDSKLIEFGKLQILKLGLLELIRLLPIWIHRLKEDTNKFVSCECSKCGILCSLGEAKARIDTKTW